MRSRRQSGISDRGVDGNPLEAPMSLALLSPHLVLLNGRIHTVDPRGTIASAVVIQDGRFLAVGTDDEVRAMAGPATPIDNLGGATVVPGLIDAHNHLLKTGIMLGQVQLYDCRTLGDVLARVAARARQMPPGTWIVGRGWDESLLAERRHP